MKNRIIFLVIFIVAGTLMIFPPQLAQAQTDGESEAGSANIKVTEGPAIGFTGAEIISQSGNVFKIGLELYNHGKKMESGIKYGIQIWETEGEAVRLMDEKVYSEILTLGQEERVKREIDYTAPSYLKGPFELQLASKNSQGLVLAFAKLGTISFSGDGQFIKILPESCYLTVEGEKESPHYNLVQGVDISPDEKLIGTCEAINYFDKEISFTSKFETYLRNSFGNLAEDNKEPQKEVSIKAGEKKTFSFPLPKALEPQAYDARLTLLSEGKPISNLVLFHYVLQGASATIQNLGLDKDYYAKGENALVSFFWSGRADSFFDARQQNNNPDKSFIELFIRNRQRQDCSVVFKQELNETESLINFSIPITKDCENPQLTAFIKQADGKILAEQSLSVISKNPPAAKKINYLYWGILILGGALIIFILAVIFRKKMKINAQSLPIIFFLIICGTMFFGMTQSARAATSWFLSTDVRLTEHPSIINTIQFKFNSSFSGTSGFRTEKYDFNPGDTIWINAWACDSFHMCTNHGRVTARYSMFVTIMGETKLIMNNIESILNPTNSCGTQWFTSFKLPADKCGAFKADYSFSVDSLGGGGLSSLSIPPPYRGTGTIDFTIKCPATYRISPSSATKNVGESQQFDGYYDTDGSGPQAEEKVTSNAYASWSSSPVATITNSGTKGVATCVSAGIATISSSYNDFGNITNATPVTLTCNPNLTVTKAGTGTGTVTSVPAGINCGSDCSKSYTSGTNVTLTATPATGSTFAGWSGDVPSSCQTTPVPSTCTVSMSVTRNVTARFDISRICPLITTQPLSQTICSGGTATLSVTASGTAPLSYQWYRGLNSDSSNPISGATNSSYTTPSLTSTTNYWVKISNSCGSVNSNTATVTVGSCAGCTGSISASPNPCCIPNGGSYCVSTINWSSQSCPSGASVYVGSSLFSSNSSGSQATGNWIGTTPNIFYLKNSANNSTLASVSVIGSASSADIKANGSNGPVSISYNTPATISWTSGNVSSCSVSPGSWTGTSNTGASTGNLTSSQTYTLTCNRNDSCGTISDSVTVNVGASVPTYVISPPSASKTIGQTQQFNGLYDPDGPSGSQAEQTVTNSASWSSSNTGIATVTNSGSKGLASCLSAGTVTITSIYSGITATASLTCSTGLPVAPTNLSATPSCPAASDADVTLTWTDNATNEQGFYVYRSTTNGFTASDSNKIATISTPNTQTYTDTNPSLSTTYYYKVRAYNAAGSSSDSNQATATTGSCPSSTYTLTVTKSGTGSGTVTSVDRKINCGSTCSTTYNSGTSVTLTATLASGSTFAGWSGDVPSSCTVSPAPANCTFSMTQSRNVTAMFNLVSPPNPTNLRSSCSADGTQATLSWDAAPGAINYQLRVDNTTNNSPSCLDGWFCADPPDKIVNNYVPTSYTASVVPNQLYNWWVHSSNAGGNSGGISSSFTCASCPASCGGCSVVCGGGTQTCTRSDCATYSQTCNTQACTLSVSLTANPASGLAPLDSILTATVGGTEASPTINYSFWWNCSNTTNSVTTAQSVCGALPTPFSGACVTNTNGAKCDGMSAVSQQSLHTYSSAGTYQPKVIVERGSLAAQDLTDATVTVTNPITYTLTVSKTGTGTGTVTSRDSRINCGGTCSRLYNLGSSVILDAVANAGSTFTGWSGACSGTGACTVLMDASKTVTARFMAPVDWKEVTP